jgi:hypothetical protein
MNSNNILQLTRNRRQYILNGTLLTNTTIKMPIMELGDYLQLTLMFYADSNLSLIFEDENIKFSNRPFIQAGRSYTFSFEYVEGTWYCEWVKLERYLKDYIYKAGDTCSALTGGYRYDTNYGSKITNANGRLSIVAYSNHYYPGKATATTISNINMTNYAMLYMDLDYTMDSVTDGYKGRISVNIGSTVVYTIQATTTRKIIAIDVSSITGLNSIYFQASGYYQRSILNIYNAWFEKNEFVDTSQEIFTSSEKTKLSSISANANKVIDSTINGNILIDGVETNVYTHPTGTNPHGTTKTDIELGNVDNTSDLNKPISTATQIALDGKIDDSQVLTNVPINAVFTDTTYDLFSSTADGLVPLSGGGITKYLRADGTWVVPSDTNTTYEVATTSANGLMSSVDKTKLDGVETGANNYVHPVNHLPSVIVQDSSNRFVTDIEKASWNGKAETSIATTSVNGLMSATDKTKIDTIESNAEVNNISDINATDLTDTGDTTLHYHATDRNRTNHTGTQLASTISDFGATVRATVLTGLTTTTNAIISATDTVLGALGKLQKQITDNLSTLTSHTSNINNPHSVTKTQVGLGNVDNTTDLLKPISTATQSALDLKINTSQKGVSNGVAQLDANGIIPSSQLPSYVDDVLEYASNSLFPATGESGKIYLNTTNNLTYRWTGSGYAEISPSIALGETSSTAYAGDKGKTTTDKVNGHIANTANPHNVTKSQLGLENVDNVSTNNQIPTYTVASNNTALVSGETLTIAFGKIAKAISSLITHLADTVSHITSTERTNWNSASTNKHIHSNKTILDNTTAPYTTTEQTKLSGISTGANNYTLPVASTVIGGVKSGTDITVDASGNVSVNDDSHNHIIANVDGLQTTLDGKVDDNQVLTNVPLNAKFTDTVYVHPTNHSPSIITQDSNNRFVTDAEKSTWNGKATQATIDTSINSIEVGGRNLLLKSNIPIANAAYLLKRYNYGGQIPLDGEVYTATIKFELGAGRNWLSLFTGGGYANVVSFYPHDINSEGIASKTFIMKYPANRFPENGFAYIDIYQDNKSGTTTSTSSVEWVKLEKGNKPTDWSPAPEDVDSAIALKADKITSGTTAQRPIPTYIGQAHFDTDLGKQINAKTLDPIVWVDGIGTVV